MDTTYYVLNFLVVLVCGLLYWQYTRRQVSTAKKEGNPVFENVSIKIDPKRNAKIIASLMTVFAGPFAAVFLGLIAYAIVSKDYPGILGNILLILVVIASFVLVYFAAYFMYRDAGFAATYNYSGLGIFTDAAIDKQYLISDEQGLHGIISLEWKDVLSAEDTDEKSIKLKTARSPKWMYDLFRMNTTELVFQSVEEKKKFEDILKSHSIPLKLFIPVTTDETKKLQFKI